MKNYIFTIIFVISLSATLTFTQEITLTRTDVDSTRSSFVTATLNFSLLVKLENVSNVTGVTFVLIHNLPDYVKFSNYKIFEFGKQGSTFVYPFYDPVSGTENIYFGILSGDTIGSTGYNSPIVAEFDFTILPSAPNGQTLTFYFSEPKAIVSEGDTGLIVNLNFNAYSFTIHSFVEVWPGDANNNGNVEINDITTIGLFLGYGSSKMNFRSFRRPNASTFWIGQLCLAWDSIPITYADCDGDGEVTLNDMLIVPLNFGKEKFSTLLFTQPHETSNVIFDELDKADIPFNSTETNYVVFSNEPLIAFALILTPEDLILKANPIDALQNNYLFYQKKLPSREEILLLVSSTNSSYSLENKQVVSLTTDKSFEPKELVATGITTSGKIIDVKLLPAKTNDFSGVIDLANSEDKFVYPITIKVYNILGNLINTYLFTNPLNNYFNDLPAGIYILEIKDFLGKTTYQKIFIN